MDLVFPHHEHLFATKSLMSTQRPDNVVLSPTASLTGWGKVDVISLN